VYRAEITNGEQIPDILSLFLCDFIPRENGETSLDAESEPQVQKGPANTVRRTFFS
jgi:hypothetical protein